MDITPSLNLRELMGELSPDCSDDHLARLRRRAWWRRRTAWLRRRLRIAALSLANRFSARPVLDPDGPVVSMTTHGGRLDRVHLALESIAAGVQRPARLVLWVDAAQLNEPLPAALRRLQHRGLCIEGSADVGPHTKYWPEVEAGHLPQRPLVTADDDVLVPRDWLQRLVQAWQQDPAAVHCHRARRIDFDADGEIKPYRQWPGALGTAASATHFALGSSGVLYPPRMRVALRDAGQGFLRCCPRADDIWLHRVALQAGLPVRQVQALGQVWDELPEARRNGLARENVRGGGNDRQLAATLSASELALLRQLAALEWH
jgi:hypothetical protein